MNNKTPRNKNGPTLLHNAAYWSSFQFDMKITGNMKKKKSQKWRIKIPKIMLD